MALSEDMVPGPGVKTSGSVGKPWRCCGCGKPIGELFRKKVHLRPPRSHAYVARYPIAATCFSCGSHNRVGEFR
jgi:hypothetical protein